MRVMPRSQVLFAICNGLNRFSCTSQLNKFLYSQVEFEGTFDLAQGDFIFTAPSKGLGATLMFQSEVYPTNLCEKLCID